MCVTNLSLEEGLLCALAVPCFLSRSFLFSSPCESNDADPLLLPAPTDGCRNLSTEILIQASKFSYLFHTLLSEDHLAFVSPRTKRPRVFGMK